MHVHYANALAGIQFETTYRHVNLLPRKKPLLLKTEALYFVKVHCSLHKKVHNLDFFVK